MRNDLEFAPHHRIDRRPVRGPSGYSLLSRLGSSHECSLRIDDPSGWVLRRHAEVSREGKLWTMTDPDSTNGLRVNREARRAFELVPGDEIELGRVTLILEPEISSCRP